MPPRGQGRGGPSAKRPRAGPSWGAWGRRGARPPPPRRAAAAAGGRSPQDREERGVRGPAIRVGSVAPGREGEAEARDLPPPRRGASPEGRPPTAARPARPPPARPPAPAARAVGGALYRPRPTATDRPRWGRGATATGRRSRPRRAPSPPRPSTPPPRRSRRSAASPAASGSGARAVLTSMASRLGSLDGARGSPLRRPSLRQVRTQRLRCLPTGLLSPRRRRG